MHLRPQGQLFGGVTTVADRFQNEDAAYFFDGFDDYIQINRKVENDFTITAWVKTTDQTDSCNAISDGKGIIDAQVDGSANDFAIVLCGSKVAFGVGSPDVMIKSTGSINTGNWTFVTVSRSSLTGEIKLYVDGLLQSSAIAGKQSLNASDKINIGALLTLTGTSYFKGSVSQAAFYHGTLTDIGVQTLYKESLISANGQQSVINTTHETVITNTSYLPYNSVSNNIDLKTWMSKVDDDTPLKQLFIPGTHDSGTFAGNFHLIQLVHTADITAIRYLIDKIPGITLYYGRTQNWNVSKQLENGIRFLDIRISDSNMFHSYKFQIRHGDDVGWGWVYHSYYGDFKKGIFDKVIEFLQINDQETVLMSIKKEGKNSTLDIKQFEKDFLEDSHFFTGSDANVTLKAVRGKIVLFSRSGFIPSEKRPGIKWGDTENFNIQDNYNDITVANKIEFVKEHFKASKDKNKYWVNFGSAYEVKVVFPILDHLAEGVNAAISTYLNDTSTDVCAMTGSIVPMDYPTRDAIHSIISANKSYRSQKITWPPTHSEVFNNLFLLI